MFCSGLWHDVNLTWLLWSEWPKIYGYLGMSLWFECLVWSAAGIWVWIWVWNLGVWNLGVWDLGVGSGCWIWVWDLGVESGCGIWVWDLGVESGCGIWVWNLGVAWSCIWVWELEEMGHGWVWHIGVGFRYGPGTGILCLNMPRHFSGLLTPELQCFHPASRYLLPRIFSTSHLLSVHLFLTIKYG
jgi:hypothetical protein